MDDMEFTQALVAVSELALDLMGDPKGAVEVLTDAIGLVSAEAGFTVGGVEDRIALVWEEFSPTNPLPPSAGLH